MWVVCPILTHVYFQFSLKKVLTIAFFFDIMLSWKSVCYYKIVPFLFQTIIKFLYTLLTLFLTYAIISLYLLLITPDGFKYKTLVVFWNKARL